MSGPTPSPSPGRAPDPGQQWADRYLTSDTSREAWVTYNAQNPQPSRTSSSGNSFYWQGEGGQYYTQPVPEPVIPSWYPGGSQSTLVVGSRDNPGNSYEIAGNTGGYAFVGTGAANDAWYNFGPSAQELLQRATTVRIGYDWSKSPNMLGDTWREAVDISRILMKQGIVKDPMQVLVDIANGNSVYGPGRTSSSSGGGGGGGGPSTTTVRTVNITSPDAAKRLVNQAMTSYLGREATKDELDAFTRALNVKEEANPTIQTITSTPSGSVMQQDQRVEGGFDQAQFTADYAQSRPDYAEYRAATDLMGAFMSIIDGPV